MTKEWAQVSCRVPSEMADAVADFLIGLSGGGVGIENLVLDTFSLDGLEDSPEKTVTAYFPVDGSLEGMLAEIGEFLVGNGPLFPGFVFREPSVSVIREQDWSSSWKENFKPIRVGEHLVVKPTWEEFSPSPGDVILELDPGMAFGTGSHPTTMLCLSVLERLLTAVAGDGVEFPQVLDVGTGSGILAIAAAKLGASRVTALDIDPEAVRVAVENCELNGVTPRVTVSDLPLDRVSGEFHIVVANILAEDLVRMAPDLAARLGPGAFLVLSGVLLEKEELVQAGFAEYGLTLTEVAGEGEWCCLVYRRES